MQTTIYIRKENEEYWNELADKSLQVNHWITVAKNGADTVTVPKIEVVPPSYKQPHTKVPNPFDKTRGVPNTSETTFVPRPPDPETGYPCCLKNRPCKHWVWDGNKSAYINSLTGKEREAI